MGNITKVACRRFKWIENTSLLNEDFKKSYNEDSDIECFIEVDVQYAKELHELPNDSPFLPERMKTEKVEKLAANLHDKKEYVMHMRNLKKTLNHD